MREMRVGCVLVQWINTGGHGNKNIKNIYTFLSIFYKRIIDLLDRLLN